MMVISAGSTGWRAGGNTRARTTRGIMAAAAAGVLFGAVLVVLVALGFLGYRALAVQSDSMAPALRAGDLIVSRPVPITRANVGDIVVFEEGERIRLAVAHRVVAYTDLVVNVQDSRTGETTTRRTRVLRTQGDANPQPDAQQVDDQRFLGVLWFSLPGIGRLLTDRLFRLALIGVVALSALVWITPALRALADRRKPSP